MTTRTRPRLLGGRYELGEMIAAGGMGEVFDAHDVRSDMPVAVKLLRAGRRSREEAARLQMEASLAAKIDHPNVVRVLDAGVDGRSFVVMERLSGRTLRDRLHGGRLDEDAVRDLGRQMLAGLSAIHAAHVAHRDVKPSNVLEGGGGSWKLADFGIATNLSSETTLSLPGQVFGSLPYVAPERVSGRETTPATDVYSVGAVLFEALTGRSAFADDDPTLVSLQIRDGARPSLRSLRPDADPALAEAIERAMSVEPTERFPSAEAFASALAASTLRSTSAPTATLTPLPAPTPAAASPPAAVPLSRRAGKAPTGRIDAGTAGRRTSLLAAVVACVILAAIVLALVAPSGQRVPAQIVGGGGGARSSGQVAPSPATSRPSPVTASSAPGTAGSESNGEQGHGGTPGNGNAYGHDGDHGNGNGNGKAVGRG